MDGFQILFVGDAAHDPQVGIQMSAIHRQIDVHCVVVGGQQYRRRLRQPGADQDLAVRGVADEQFVGQAADPRAECGVLLDQVHRHVLALECLCRGAADPPAADHHDRVGVDVVDDQQRVQFQHLGFGADHDDDARVGQIRVGRDGLQAAAFPDADDVDPDGLAQPGLADRAAGQRRIVQRELGHAQVAEAADLVRLRGAAVDAVAEPLAQPSLERQDVRAAAHLQDVHGRVALHGRQNRHVGGGLADAECDVRIPRVGTVGEDQPRLGGAHGVVRRAAVDVAGHDGYAGLVPARGDRGVGFEHDVRHVVQPLDQPGRDAVVAADHDVAARVGRQGARGTQPHLRFQPGRVEEADEGEGQNDEQQDDARQQHQQAEQPAEVAVERDVAEPERAHHGQRPVHAGQPRMRLAFDVQHDDVKNDGEDRDDRDDERDHLEQRADVPARLPLAQEVGELRNEQLHARSPPPRVGVSSRRNAGCTGKRPVGGPIGSRAGRWASRATESVPGR